MKKKLITLDQGIFDALQKRANKNMRSLNKEISAILKSAVSQKTQE